MKTLIALALLSALTYHRVGVWRTGQTLWKDAVQASPCSTRAHWNLSQAYEAGSPERLAEVQKTALLAMGEVKECTR